MSKVRLTGTTSGFTELTAPATAGNNTITLPSSNGSANQLLKNGVTAGALEYDQSCDLTTAGGYLRFNKAGFVNAGVCCQTDDLVTSIGGGSNPVNSGLNISLSGPDRVSTFGWLVRWNTTVLYQWNKTDDYHAWNTGGLERFRIRGEGNVALGGAGANNVSFYNQKPITGSTTAHANLTAATVQSDVATTAYGYRTSIGSVDFGASPAFTNLIHYEASQGTLVGSPSNQWGFRATSGLTGGASNMGFRSELASSVGVWNFYATGTAPNYFAGDVRTNTVVTQRAAPTNSNTSTTATAASLLDGLRTGTPAAAINLTLPTGANMDLAFQELQTNQAFEWSVINLAAATHAITVVQNTGHTVVGNMVVAANSSGRFLTRKTAADTFITYRIA